MDDHTRDRITTIISSVVAVVVHDALRVRNIECPCKTAVGNHHRTTCIVHPNDGTVAVANGYRTIVTRFVGIRTMSKRSISLINRNRLLVAIDDSIVQSVAGQCGGCRWVIRRIQRIGRRNSIQLLKIAHQIAIGIDDQRIGFETTRQAIDFLTVRQAISIGINNLWIGLVNEKLIGVTETIVVGICQSRICAIFIIFH